jgi:hypothetical protein
MFRSTGLFPTLVATAGPRCVSSNYSATYSNMGNCEASGSGERDGAG